MKLLAAAVLAALLSAGLFLVPISGHTLWQRAEARGLPQAAARAMSNGAHAAVHAAVRWAEEKRARSSNPPGSNPRKVPHKEVARQSVPPARAPDQPGRTQLSLARYRNGADSRSSAPGAAARDSDPSDGRDSDRADERDSDRSNDSRTTASTPDSSRAISSEGAARTPPLSPAPAHDRIVAAPAKERLSDGDRQGLDKLIARSREQQ